ncbi:replicative DNA helicase [Thiohalophilus thiocyanatoxydans]|uniref:Replicative DNA helicase n=1 Tax=Thiohalophilus thiocyanatoxydans TaxID=381308 RepID=A0A4R8IX15_9GAMM|nr:replicative DNA helicase [Thiohalophilus thiocyanatoxydans]TDY02377.1 primary replicative DNA helicase [Thiohalophilus thiocyanatoxydans]
MPDAIYSVADSDQATDALKVPPHSIEAEQAVLGGLMIDNSSWDQVVEQVSESDFYRRDHRLIFSAIAALAEEANPCDVVTLSEWLQQRNQLDAAGGMSYLGGLAKNTPTAANIKAYAAIVRERSVLRQLTRVATEIGNLAYNPEGRSSAEVLDQAEKAVFDIAEQGAHNRSGYVGIKELLVKAVDRIDTLYQSSSAYTGVPTGYTDFDDMTSGLQNSDLIIIAGRPSMGKTSFAMNLVENAAIKHQTPVAVFSMEMPGEQLVMRMMSSLGRIDQHKIRTGKLDDADWPRLTSAVGILNEAPIYIDDTPGLSPMEVRSRARRIKREHGLGLIVIDYLQLMQVSGNTENRATEISEISRGLKGLAKELNVPVITLSQLNRSLEQRPNKRPVMSDLRESGAIEQDADVIVFIYRDEVYDEESSDKGTAEIIISKQRNGPIGTTRLTFLGQYTKFENYISGDNYLEGPGG